MSPMRRTANLAGARRPRDDRRSMTSRTIRVAVVTVLGMVWTVAASGEAFAQVPLTGGTLVARVDSLAQARLIEGPSAGFTIGVKRGGDLLLLKGYGAADLENGVRASAETLYQVGSISKTFEAAAVMRLVDEGRIDLDASVSTYLPDFPLQGHRVTVRHLLQHTSGIPNYTQLPEYRAVRETRAFSPQELQAFFANRPFNFEPGEKWEYSNSNYFLLGRIIEALVGRPFHEYLADEILAPLGLTRTMYCDPDRILRNRAQGYRRAGGELFNDEHLRIQNAIPSGSLCSTVPDLLRWSDALHTGRVVSEASLKEMREPGVLTDGTRTEYGLGLFVGEIDGVRGVGHSGDIDGFAALMVRYLDEDLDIIILSNTRGPPVLFEMERSIAGWALEYGRNRGPSAVVNRLPGSSAPRR